MSNQIIIFLLLLLLFIVLYGFILWPAIKPPKRIPEDKTKPLPAIIKNIYAFISFSASGIRIVFVAYLAVLLFTAEDEGPVFAVFLGIGLLILYVMAKNQHIKKTTDKSTMNRTDRWKFTMMNGAVGILAFIAFLTSIAGIAITYYIYSNDRDAIAAIFAGIWSCIILSGSLFFFKGVPIVPTIGRISFIVFIPVALFIILGLAASGISP